ncbi:hypothetical protein BABINDRAFT_161162 [Babjeviella inositovora NRRL Y-12698]|uniref:Diphthine--ammonia ligase n=1 Tax=Babjeviella inositovora NRRL Y-12698 TaxID=984486 RepID=A0A1E3QR45_9ASCO|nr:uncharacterized protein BABINDRAFT_161162 [Babjeviella inositovora NRRL Y-12698]ODQ80186.1 hypothetical protein BABINDRAFT_161162 [Babjeviella inositovora NRRL Y-12698]
MKFVALLSGGKDSCYNILHCLLQGHELVALANLHPAQSGVDELDSHMFQTVGHDIVDYYSECIGVPMYRQEITGSSKNQKLEYESTQDDEIEDLYVLLHAVRTRHPDVRGVSVGAILSTYQRTRVENVCARLGLTSLAYLWQRDQTVLMREMCASGLDARIIKVAAIGLSARHLGRTIQEMGPVLEALNAKYDVHVCGEGGEFETMVFDAPFFKKRLEITEQHVVEVSSDDVCYLKFAVRMVDKEGYVMPDWKDVVVPPLLSESFQDVYELVEKKVGKTESEGGLRYDWKMEAKVLSTETSLYISNLQGEEAESQVEVDSTKISNQIKDIFGQLSTVLSRYGLNFADIQSTSLLVADMANFSEINTVYSSFFPNVLPPARMCVETYLRPGCGVQLSCVVKFPGAKAAKAGVHVRGLSYWAPCNIGPYSQAIVDTRNAIASLAGQIPLIPASMALHDSSTPETLAESAILALQHLNNVKAIVKCREDLAIVCFITDLLSVRVVKSVWSEYQDVTQGNPGVLVIVLVSHLPRNAEVEWGGLSFDPVANQRDMYYDSDDESEEDALCSMLEALTVDKTTVKTGTVLVSTMFFNVGDESEIGEVLGLPQSHFQIYGAPERVAMLTTLMEKIESVEYLPVGNVWDHAGVKHDFAIVVRTEN